MSDAAIAGAAASQSAETASVNNVNQDTPSESPLPVKSTTTVSSHESQSQFNFASFDCGAVIRDSNKGAKGVTAILSENKDQYLLNRCQSGGEMFVVVELCDEILIDSFQLANFEYFSSMIKDFTVLVSNRYPPQRNNWIQIGQFRAHNSRDIQRFQIEKAVVWAKYMMLRFESFYGNEYYCPLSLIRVYGRTMMQDLRQPISQPGPATIPAGNAATVPSTTASAAKDSESMADLSGSTGESGAAANERPSSTKMFVVPATPALPVLTYSWTEVVPTGFPALVFEDDFLNRPPPLEPLFSTPPSSAAATAASSSTTATATAETTRSTTPASPPNSETAAAVAAVETPAAVISSVDSTNSIINSSDNSTVPSSTMVNDQPPGNHQTLANQTTNQADNSSAIQTNLVPLPSQSPPPPQAPIINDPGDDPTENVFKSIIMRVMRLEDNWQQHNQRLQESLHQLETVYRQRFDKFFLAFNQSSYYHLEQLRRKYDSIFLGISNDMRHLVAKIDFDLNDFRQKSSEQSSRLFTLQIWAVSQLALVLVLIVWLRRSWWWPQRTAGNNSAPRRNVGRGDGDTAATKIVQEESTKPFVPFVVRIQSHFRPLSRLLESQQNDIADNGKGDGCSSSGESDNKDGLFYDSFQELTQQPSSDSVNSSLAPFESLQSSQPQQRSSLHSHRSRRLGKKRNRRRHSLPNVHAAANGILSNHTTSSASNAPIN